MNYSKILAFLIALFQAPIVLGMETGGNTETIDETALVSSRKRQIVSGDGKTAVGPVADLNLTDGADDKEGALVLHTSLLRTPLLSEKKRRMLRIGEGSFAQVYISTRKMVEKGLLAIETSFPEMHLSEFSVLKERVSRGLLRVEIPLVREPYLESEAFLRRFIEGYLRAASMYYEGHKVAENKEAALYHFEGAARKGSSTGSFHTALMLDVGDGVPSDKPRAANFYALAMRRGHPVAPYNLGMMLLNNEVGESYPGETLQFTIFLARKGMPQAQEILCRMGILW